ncbi:hypothetical protein PLICRDRAFT_41664 [Plicaturopsis crispa FD-325 SS-3]|nr:hypothetical protein PLICRDRAFT_41664 [Plicaturopsis crispa FD-325 SS-3]
MSEASTSKLAQKDVDIYKALPPIRNQRVKLSSAAPFTPTYVQANLTQSSDPAGLYASRIQGRQILLENPAQKSKASEQRNEKRKRDADAKQKRSSRVMTARTAQARGMWKLEKTQIKFELFLPLHHLWLGYMSELLGLPALPSPNEPLTAHAPMPSSAGMHAKLVKADFHGSIMTVRQSKNPCLVGISGIVVHETENAFRVVTKKDQSKLIPKPHSIFSFAVPLYATGLASAQDASRTPPPRSTVLDSVHIEFELHGNQFCFRAGDRAGRKFKHKETIEL